MANWQDSSIEIDILLDAEGIDYNMAQTSKVSAFSQPLKK
jgi:hypothetical protein